MLRKADFECHRGGIYIRSRHSDDNVASSKEACSFSWSELLQPELISASKRKVSRLWDAQLFQVRQVVHLGPDHCELKVPRADLDTTTEN